MWATPSWPIAPLSFERQCIRDPGIRPGRGPHGDAIVMPSRPEGWEVANVEIFPSTFGPSVEIVIRTEALGTASLFAVRPGKTKFASVTLTHKGDWNAANWQVGEVAYALVAKVTPENATKLRLGSLNRSYDFQDGGVE